MMASVSADRHPREARCDRDHGPALAARAVALRLAIFHGERCATGAEKSQLQLLLGWRDGQTCQRRMRAMPCGTAKASRTKPVSIDTVHAPTIEITAPAMTSGPNNS
jgi:hypothetical protein